MSLHAGAHCSRPDLEPRNGVWRAQDHVQEDYFDETFALGPILFRAKTGYHKEREIQRTPLAEPLEQNGPIESNHVFLAWLNCGR